MTRAQPESRSRYFWFRQISTQWKDNDVYGHINNAVHYTWIDTTVNAWLIEHGLLTIGRSRVVGLVASSSCQYFSETAFPDQVCCGLRVQRLGRTSITYETGMFRNDDDLSFAYGTFTHVYVDAQTRAPMPLSDPLRTTARALTYCGDVL